MLFQKQFQTHLYRKADWRSNLETWNFAALLLCKLTKKTNFFIKNEYDKLCSSDSSPPRIYGTPKMHKFSSRDWFSKLCQIASLIGTFNYNLTHFLCDVHSPLVPNNYLCKDAFSFASQIKNANISGKFPVSYDVNNLFTIILLQETIDLAINLISNHDPKLSITEEAFSFFYFKNLFLFATSQTHFMFYKKFYNQIDGVAMGYPLAPALATNFMGF